MKREHTRAFLLYVEFNSPNDAHFMDQHGQAIRIALANLIQMEMNRYLPQTRQVLVEPIDVP